MTKTFEKAVTGYNHNIQHKGKVYHVQTEDSGINNPHIITHLFVGGNIVASKKTSYAELRNLENLQQVVREMMEKQHKEMLRNLIRGAYDASAAARAPSFQPGQLATEAQARDLEQRVAATATKPSHLPAVAPAPAVAARPPKTTPPTPALAATRPPPPQPVRPVPPVRSSSLFGEGAISEKSLDEVILSYLATEKGEGS